MKDFDMKIELVSRLVEKFDAVESALSIHRHRLKVKAKDVEFALELTNEGIELVEDVSWWKM